MVIPPGIAALPRFGLIDGPSPLAPLRRFSAALGGGAEVWIKREDLLPLAFGGNKLRNLEFLVGAALAEGADTLITSGRRWSNHCRLTAAAGRAGRARRPSRPHRPAAARRRRRARTSALDELLGATRPRHRDRRSGRAGRARRVDSRPTVRAAGRRPFVIGVGGTGPVGAAGQVLAGLELADQLDGGGVGGGDGRPAVGDRRDPGRASSTGLALAAPPIRAGRRDRGRRAGRGAPADDPRRSSTGLAPLAGARVAADARSSSRTTSSATATAARRRPPTRRPASSPGPRASSSTRSTPRRRWPGSSPASATGASTGPVVFWHAGGTPGLVRGAGRGLTGSAPAGCPPGVAELASGRRSGARPRSRPGRRRRTAPRSPRTISDGRADDLPRLDRPERRPQRHDHRRRPAG